MEYQDSKSHIHAIARGLLVRGEDVILCRVKNKDWYFLPGGHIEDGESAKTALLRELREEMGEGDYTISSFIGVCENIFPLEEGLSQHEMNIVFRVDVPADFEPKAREEHIEFVCIAKNDLANHNILPAHLKEGIVEWFKDGKTFLK